MANNNDKKVLNVPALRFPEFTDEWHKQSLGEIGETIIGLTYKPSDVVESNGTIVLRSSNIKNGVIDYSDLVRVNKPIKERIITKENDILICARNGSQRLIGKNAIIKQEDANNTFGAFMMVYRSKDNPFILPLLSTKRYFSQVGENLGARINQITTSDFNGFDFYFPNSHAERAKIAELFRLIDERIATQNKIIEKLQSLIKGLNDSLYKQYGNAITTSFSDLGHSYSGLSGKSSEDFGSGKPFITYLNVYSNSVVNENEYQYVRINDGEKQNIVQCGDVLFTLSSETPEEVGVGSVYLGIDEVFLNSFCFGFHIDNKELAYPPYFSYYVSSTPFRKFIYPFAQGSTRFNLCKADFEKASIKLPSLNNQKHIYAILNSIKGKIETEKNLLEYYTTQKQYLLRQMFI
ncbi:restriction endonuclease subunit S [Bacteroides thetaiotaomicron]|uniref:restriction endonuclease subunit S n=1 Tax=Bacteroides thetaiotaomicron TaxID=818 RepID=UPI00232F1D41|nr:restriction endonuclease subunit S [Bacteroides thetaiotaomicron]MDC2173624.1 restriction endonuclease subunit S [Bacteroides thetaiotaomicron]MDC2189072.1 restriction endonuclease subunit S [Bacteroides thetaiotaomicron]